MTTLCTRSSTFAARHAVAVLSHGRPHSPQPRRPHDAATACTSHVAAAALRRRHASPPSPCQSVSWMNYAIWRMTRLYRNPAPQAPLSKPPRRHFSPQHFNHFFCASHLRAHDWPAAAKVSIPMSWLRHRLFCYHRLRFRRTQPSQLSNALAPAGVSRMSSDYYDSFDNRLTPAARGPLSQSTHPPHVKLWQPYP